MNGPKRIGRLAKLIFLVLYGTLMFALKFAMMNFPNIEPVTPMIICLTSVFGAWAFVSVYVYVGLELYIFGLGIWNVMYLYVWALLTLLIWALRRPVNFLDGFMKNKGIFMSGYYSIVAGVFGVLFGMLCCIPYIFAFGIEYAVAWVITGFPFDITHCVGNIVMTAILFYPLFKVMNFAKRKFLV